VATSFLSPADVAEIHRTEADGYATAVALDPFVLTLYRFNKATGQYEARPMQTVVMTYANRTPREGVSETAETTAQEGTFEKDVPFDVALGDRFSLATGQDGVITKVPPSAGITQTVDFLIDEGRAS
jgi:hypothetical protein